MRPFIRLAASIAVSALLAACSNSEQARKEHFDNAERFMAADKTQEAIVEYRNACGKTRSLARPGSSSPTRIAPWATTTRPSASTFAPPT
jgi:hypothetical protein